MNDYERFIQFLNGARISYSPPNEKDGNLTVLVYEKENGYRAWVFDKQGEYLHNDSVAPCA